MSETYLSDFQEEIVSRILADEYFSDVTVLYERKQDLENEIERALGTLKEKGSKIGVCVVVMSPEVSVNSSNIARPIMDLDISIRVLEDVVVNSSTNGTQKMSINIARRVLRVLYDYISTGVVKLLRPKNPAISFVDDPIASLAYEVRFTTKEDDRDIVDKVSCVSISLDAGVLTLSTATSAASIYFTTDGSYPWVSNSEATLYNPLNKPVVTETCTIRAGAYKNGLIASNISTMTVT